MNKRTLFVGIASFSLIALVILAASLFARPVRFNGTVYAEPYPPAPDFELASAGGGNVALNGMRGKLVLLFFGYTNCPDECPTTMAKIRLAYDTLGEQSADIRVLFVTTDPARDTASALTEFLSRFNASFVGLTGSAEELQKVWDSYGIYVEEGGEVHSIRVYVVDRDGNLRLTFPYDMDSEAMVSDLKILLSEK